MKQKLNVALIAGILCNILLILVFGFIYYSSSNPTEIQVPPVVRIPSIDDVALKGDLQKLIKIEGIPIPVVESDLGKEDPYNP